MEKISPQAPPCEKGKGPTLKAWLPMRVVTDITIIVIIYRTRRSTRTSSASSSCSARKQRPPVTPMTPMVMGLVPSFLSLILPSFPFPFFLFFPPLFLHFPFDYNSFLFNHPCFNVLYYCVQNEDKKETVLKKQSSIKKKPFFGKLFSGGEANSSYIEITITRLLIISCMVRV